jgi:hypothetical protein
MLFCVEESMKSFREEEVPQQLTLLHNAHDCCCFLEENKKKDCPNFRHFDA